MKVRRIVIISLLIAIASILGYVESLIPISLVPGVKLGLANIIILYAIYHFKWYEALIITLFRIVLVSLVLGSFLNIGFFMSLSGGLLSFLVMILLKQIKKLSLVFISITGALIHGIGQVLVATFVMNASEVVYYLPFIMLLSIPTGVIVGVIVARLNKYDFMKETKDEQDVQ